MGGDVARSHGQDSPVLMFSAAVGMGIVSASVQISNPNDLKNFLKHLKCELGSVMR